MSDPEPSITWIGSPHHFDGRQGHQPIALVIHTMGGTLAGTDSWFKNPSSQVSAHYGISLTGETHQYVKLSDGAWANGIIQSGAGYAWPGPPGVNPNLLTISVETEDKGRTQQEVTLAQYTSTLAVCRMALRTYPSIRYLVTHRAISPRDRPLCPGPRWLASGRFQSLADALGIQAIT